MHTIAYRLRFAPSHSRRNLCQFLNLLVERTVGARMKPRTPGRWVSSHTSNYNLQPLGTQVTFFARADEAAPIEGGALALRKESLKSSSNNDDSEVRRAFGPVVALSRTLLAELHWPIFGSIHSRSRCDRFVARDR